MLIVFGGRPGTGKSTISRALAARRRALLLRIDTIEQAIRDSGVLKHDVGIAGYAVAQALAAANLANGIPVIADCVNPVRESREGWREVAARAGVPIVEVEVLCSDPAEHRRRVETRVSDIPGLTLPDWAAVITMDFDPWPEPHLVIDTARLDVAEALAAIEAASSSRD